MTHLLCDHDNIGESVSWCDYVLAHCSEDPDEVDCVTCLRTFLDYGEQVQRRLAVLTTQSSAVTIPSHPW